MLLCKNLNMKMHSVEIIYDTGEEMMGCRQQIIKR